MNNSVWPTFAEAETMAQKAHFDGMQLRMLQVDTGWEWTWLHVPSGMTFEGSCDTSSRAIAVVCALQSLPVIIFNVDETTVEPK